MKKLLIFMFYFALAIHVTAAVFAGICGNWVALAWIITATLWMIDSFFTDKRARRYLRESIKALEECAKANFDCLKLSIENHGLEIKNLLLTKKLRTQEILRKMHFARLRKINVKKF